MHSRKLDSSDLDTQFAMEFMVWRKPCWKGRQKALTRVAGQHRSYEIMIGGDRHVEVLYVTTENGSEEETLSRFKNSLKGCV